jgi:hypothetical protein
VQSGIAQCNLSVAAFLFCGFALYLAWRRYESASGILLALGFCIKPTIGIAFLVAIALYGRKRCCLTFAIFLASITAWGAVAMLHVDPVWKMDYARNVAFLFGPHGAASFTTKDPARFDLINLQVPFYALTGNSKLSEALTVVTFIVLGGAWLLVFYNRRGREADWDWLGVGSLLLIGLLPVYQRNYNAGVVIFAAMWAFGNLPVRNFISKAVPLVCWTFLVPGEAMLRGTRLQAHFDHNVVWNGLILPHLTWTIVLVVVGSCLIKLDRDAVGGVSTFGISAAGVCAKVSPAKKITG